MGRWGCVDVPALPLQLLLQREPEWAGHAACVVEDDAPQAKLLWVNEAARRVGVLPGQRYAAALSLARDLRAGIVGTADIAAGVARIAARLTDFTPDVEPAADEPGVFWLDGDGLGGLFESASAWGRGVHGALVELGFTARVVVGFTRYGAYAVAKSVPLRGPDAPVVVFRDPREEQDTARNVPLGRLGLEPGLRDDLAKLGVSTLGGFLELPEGGLHERFGNDAARMHRLASGAAWAPLQPFVPGEPIQAQMELGYPDGDLQRLLGYVESMAGPLLARLAAQQDAARAVRVLFRLETRAVHEETIQPARPTADLGQLMELVRLRLEYTRLPSKAEEIEVELLPAPANRDQLDLLPENPRRDLAAANRALARLRAEFGPAAIVRARLREGHLPEGTFLWEPLEGLEKGSVAPLAAEGAAAGPGPHAVDESGPRPGEAVALRRDAMRGTAREASSPDATKDAARARGPMPVLVRRLYDRPRALPPRSHHLRDDGWLIHNAIDGAVVKLTGPFLVSGGWWVHPVHREYHFAETARGDLLWVFYDRERRRWFLQGQVE